MSVKSCNLAVALLMIGALRPPATARAEDGAAGKSAAVAAPRTTAPAGPRQVVVQGFAAYPPLFARQANTLDPLTLARQSWKGWISKRGIPWGMTADLQPTLRLSFDCRALPWPSIKQHSVDGPDNNMRAVDGLALLHAMLGDEMRGDRAEAGIIAYLASCTDPQTGIPYSPDSMSRSCAIGHGEHTKNLILMCRYTGQEKYREWARRAIETLRRYAVVSERPGVGKVATYCQGMFAPGSPPVTETKDPTMGGWLHLAVGWNLWAFSEWYELTGDANSLDFAVALANRLCNGEDPKGNDGSFRPDGSFGGKDQASCASWHMHGHTHGLPGLTHLGGQLVKAGRREAGLRMINQVSRTFDWLYDPARNPDAGSLTGWLGEWLMVATGWPRKADCEGCTMGDIVQAACMLGAASRSDPSLAGLVDYYDRAEQIFTSQLVEQVFRITPRYLAVVKECIGKRVAKDMAKASPAARAEEVERRYTEALATAERMVGQQMGTCGFPDWVNHQPSDLDPELPGIHMQGCCADATIRAAHAVWSETVTGDSNEARVNLAVNRSSPLVDVVSCLPHRGEVDIVVKAARRVLVRVPAWAPRGEVKAFVDAAPVAVSWCGSYVGFDRTAEGQRLTVTYPLRIAQVRERINGAEYTERWRGNTIVDIAPPGKWIPMFQRPELERVDMP
jgi:hypothetical protein